MLSTIDIENPDQLIAYLQHQGSIAPGDHPLVTVLQGGVSNRTVLVEHDGESWVLKQALSKLRVAVDWYADPERIHREPLGLRWLDQLGEAAISEGFAEIVKIAVARSRGLFERIERSGKEAVRPRSRAFETILLEAARLKADVVAADEREAG